MNQLKYFNTLISDKIYLNGLLAISFTVFALSLFLSHSSKTGIAKAALEYAYNSIVIGDYRTTINILDKNIPENFQFISLKNNYSEISKLGTKPRLNIMIKLNISEGKQENATIGEIAFYYSPLLDLVTATLATLLVTAIYSFIFLRELLSQEKKLELQNRIMKLNADNELALQVSHDIRSPLSALKVVAGKLSSENEELSNLLTMSAIRINDIANQLLIKSRTSAPNPALDMLTEAKTGTGTSRNPSDEFNINKEVSNLIEEKRLSIRPSIKINLQIDETNEIYLEIKKSELMSALSNLINNSAEAMIEDSGLIQVITRKYSQSVLLIVQDNGRGIPEDKLSTIGDRGVSFGKSSNSESGTGLGIYQAKKFMQSIDGKLEILSREGMGTMITLTIPYLKND